MSYYIITFGNTHENKLAGLVNIYSTELFTFSLEANKIHKEITYLLPSEHNRLFILIVGSIYNENELRIGLDKTDGELIEVIKMGYEKWDTGFFNYLNGDYTLVIFDYMDQQLIVGQDHVGAIPLYYYSKGKFLSISNHPKLIKPYTKNELSLEWVFHYISRSPQPLSHMPVKEIFKTIPGNLIHFDQSFGLRQLRYWKLDALKPLIKINEKLAIKEFYNFFAKAVSRRVANPSASLGCELSGGIDSSGVIAMMKKQTNNANITSFSHVSPVKHEKPVKTDEKDDILAVADFVGIKKNVFINESQLNTLESARKVYEHFGFPYYFGMLQDVLFDNVNSESVDLLFSGYGGDQFISNQGRRYFNELVKDNSYLKLFKEVNQLKKGRGKASVVLFLKIIFVVKFRFLFRFKNRIQALLIKPNNRFLTKHMKRKYTRFNLFQKSPKNKVIFLREGIVNNITNSNFIHRLEMSYHIGKMKNFTYRYPLLDKELMEYYYKLPNEFKFKKGMGRYIYRKSLQGLVPDHIQWKTNKFIGVIPGRNMIVSNNMDEIKDYLLNLKKKGSKNRIFDIDALLKQHSIAENHLKTEDTNKNNRPVADFMRVFHLLIYLEEFHDGPQ